MTVKDSVKAVLTVDPHAGKAVVMVRSIPSRWRKWFASKLFVDLAVPY